MILRDGMTCVVCEKGKLYPTTKPHRFNYKGDTIILNRETFVCTLCREEFFQNDVQKEVDETLKKFRTRVEVSFFGHGIKQDEQTDDYYADPECNEAYHLGYGQGEATVTKNTCDMRDHMLLNKHGVKKCLVCGKHLNNL